MNLAEIVRAAGRVDSVAGRDVVDIITFIEASWGLNLPLYPVQRVVLKTFYGLELDDKEEFVVTDWRRENPRRFTERGYLRMLHDEGRSNVREVEGHERRELVLPVGRRSGKSLMSACVASYETYRLISKGDPQAYYGVSPTSNIQIICIATDKDQAGLLYQETSGHFRACEFFRPYTANNTQSYARFQTPRDITKYGSYREDPTAKATIKVTFKSCIAKGLRGPGNIVVILDEVAHFTDKGQSSADEIYTAVVPATAAYTPKNPNDKREPIGPIESKIINISSPLGRQGMFFKLFSDGFSNRVIQSERLCLQTPTWEINPTIPAGVFESEYVKDTRAFFTEFGAQFTDRTRGWIEDARDVTACIDPQARPRLRAPPRQPHFAGIDAALVGDYSTIAIGHLDAKGRIVTDVVEGIRAGEGDYVGHERLDFDDIVAWYEGFAKRFFITEGIFDSHLGLVLEQALAKRGLKQFRSHKFTPQLNTEVFANFKHMLLDKRVVLYDWPLPEDAGEGEHCLYIRELLSLQAEYKSKYITVVEKPRLPGATDDHADALVRMVWLAAQSASKPVVFAGQHPGTAPASIAHARALAARAMTKARKKAALSGSSPERQVQRRGTAWRRNKFPWET